VVSEQETRNEMLKRVLDLKNGNRKAIETVNKSRIVDEFGKGKDTGSTDVQGMFFADLF
jgi:hypothetical protein